MPATARDELFALYRDALQMVLAATGLAMEPSATLREYARRVRERLGDVFVQDKGSALANQLVVAALEKGVVDKTLQINDLVALFQ
jgi:hypothetical protein